MNSIASARLAGRVAAAVLCLFLGAPPASAQLTTGSVAGIVQDAQSGVVPGATVVLINEAQGTRSASVVTDGLGAFLFVNVATGTYTVEVTMPSFKTLKRSGLSVSPGSRAATGSLTLEVGGATEIIDVKGVTPLIQATSGERSFTVTTEAVESLPIANRSFIALALLAPGVSGTAANAVRTGGGGDTNIMMDGVSVMDTGSNRPLLQMNVESIAEVKVLTSGYQAEYGRSSGLQITAVTKSGTNRFRGSVYDVERDSDWYNNSRTNILNGDPKAIAKERDWGFSIGGPIGKAGGNNRLFFFYSQEFEPRTGGNNVVRYRMPTLLERAGDFSQTTDNLGAPYPYIKDPRLTGACTAATQAGCFADGNVLGRIPADMLYQTGLNVLNQFPLPNMSTIPAGVGYNFEVTRPAESVLSWQPGLRVDYQATPTLRATFKYSGWTQRMQTINGSLPGFNDSRMQNPTVSTWAVSANYSVTPTMFLEATYGHSQNELAGCALAQTNTGPSFCTAAVPMNDTANRFNVGLGNLPLLFPEANILNPDYYAKRALDGMNPRSPAWVDGNVVKAPTFAFGGRIANANTPPNTPFPDYFNVNSTNDVAISLTKVSGRHTLKTGFYYTHSYKAEQATGINSFGALSFANDTVGTNPYDTSFGFANAAIGSFSSYAQASNYVEGNYVYGNIEGYVQDNWKVSNRLTLDYGLRLVHQQPQYDKLDQATNFLSDQWQMSAAPALYLPGCLTTSPCTGTNRQAKNPVTGQLLGPNTTLAIGALVPGSGDPVNGLFSGGNGIVDTTYTFPALGVAPRFGAAYDLTGRQRVVVRGGAGLFFDRPFGNSVIFMAGNPPTSRQVTVRYGQLQSLGLGGLTTQGPPALNTIDYEPGLPSSWQWNSGVQMTLPWNVALDVSYVGQHSYNGVRTINLNAVDFGETFLPENQDPTLTPTTPGATAYSTDLLRAFQGYGAISHRAFDLSRTYHSIQVSFTRRFANGVSFSFNDTMGLSDRQNAPARLQHAPDGTVSFRADQAEADDLLGDNAPQAHLLRANFVWDLPDLKLDGAAWKAIGFVVNDWQLSGIWSAATGAAYTIATSYQSGGTNANLTGTPDYAARVRVVGTPGYGCHSNVYQQFDPSLFQGPVPGSVGLESGSDYIRGCFSSVLDLAIARNIPLPQGRNIQIRVDMFNAPNAAGITGRNTSMTLTSPSDPVNIRNLPYDANGNLIDGLSKPRGAGFGVANAYQAPRTIQAQIRFSF